MDEMRLKGKKIAILTSEMYEDLELWYPYFRMQESARTALWAAGGFVSPF